MCDIQCVSKSVAHNMNTSICSRKVMHSTILSENRHMHRKRIIKELSFFILGPEEPALKRAIGAFYSYSVAWFVSTIFNYTSHPRSSERCSEDGLIRLTKSSFFSRRQAVDLDTFASPQISDKEVEGSTWTTLEIKRSVLQDVTLGRPVDFSSGWSQPRRS